MATAKRLAEEAQLLAEHRWIVDALKKIRTERNGLQIERLQLESMLALLKNGPPSNEKIKEQDISKETTSHEVNKPDLVTICNMSHKNTNVEVSECNKMLDDEVCNFEELNLSVTNPYINLRETIVFEDEEEEFEESDSEGMQIDINMFMNSQTQ